VLNNSRAAAAASAAVSIIIIIIIIRFIAENKKTITTLNKCKWNKPKVNGLC